MALADAPWVPRRHAALRRFLGHRLAVVSLLVLAGLVVLTVIAGVLPFSDPTDGDAYHQDALPSRLHLLGTDEVGHDLLSALVFALRSAFAVGIAGQLVTTLLGVGLGVVAAHAGGRVDALLGRFTDLVFALPIFPLAFLIASVLGPDWDGLYGGAGRVLLITMVFGLLGWLGLMRFVRGQVLTLKEQEFVEAARAVGLSPAGIILRHLLPNIWGLVLVQVTFGIGGFIYFESALSLLGLGVQPPNPDLGALVVAGAFHLDINPYESLAPAALLGVLVVAFAYLGDGLRDALDPRAAR